MAVLDNKFPVLFFPIRLETKYHITDEGKRILRIRFFPDQISIDTFDPRLTNQEITDAKDYWTTVKSIEHTNTEFENNRENAWQKLVNKYGCNRAAYISKSVIKYDPVQNPDPTNPEFREVNGIEVQEEDIVGICRALPRTFRVYGKFKDESSPTFLGESNQILKELHVGSFTFDDDIEIHDSLKWLTSFKAAKDNGMAIEIELTEDRFLQGFEYIFVCGVKDDLTPQETKIFVENLFRAHHYTTGFSFLKQGTPTNLVNRQTEQNNSFSSLSSSTNVKTCRQIEFSGLFALESQPFSVVDMIPDGRIFEKKLGVDHLSSGVNNANNMEQISAAYMSILLLPVIIGELLKKTQLSDIFLTRLRGHFIKNVRAQGSIPPFRIGKVPYGILPLTHLSHLRDFHLVIDWEDSSLIQNYSAHIGTFFHYLKNIWLEHVNDVPTIMNIPNGVSPEKQLVNILSMEAFSHSYYVRGLRDYNYIENFISKKLGIILNVIANRLLEANKTRINTMLKSLFNIQSVSTIPLDLTELYRRILGSGFTRMNIPYTSKLNEDKEITVPTYLMDMYLDLNEFGIDSNYLKTSEEQSQIDGFLPLQKDDSLLFKLLRYSASILGGDLNQINDISQRQKSLDESKFAESLKFLSKTVGEKDPLGLESLMLQVLDLASYRLDAWLTSFANQRLDYLREYNDVTKTGLYIGCYGWIENLKPKNIGGPAGESPKKSVYPGGYIQSPSYAHATSAAVLRDGYLTHSNDLDKKDLLKINLTSKRTKDALEIIRDIHNISLNELLGYKFERRLHDDEIDYLIDEFRKYFVLKKDDLKELEGSNTVEASKERIVPRNLVDGFSVYKHWKRLIENIANADALSIKNFMANDLQGPNDRGWHSFYIEIRIKYAQDDQKIIELINRLKPHLDFLLDQIDALSDLSIAESVYQAVNGNYERSAAVLDGLSGEGEIPIPEVASIPVGGTYQVQKIVLATETDPLIKLNLRDINDNSNINTSFKNPRIIAEPNLNRILKSYYGDILFWIYLKDHKDGNVISPPVEVTLSSLGLEPIDLLHIKETELKNRLKYYGKTSNLLDNNSSIVYYCDVEQFDKKPPSEKDNIDKKSFSELQLLIRSLQEMFGQSIPLKYSDFISPQSDISDNSGDDSIQTNISKNMIMEIFQRFYDLVFLTARTIEELETAENNTLSIEIKREAIMNASFFNLSSDIFPIYDDEIIIDSEKLNEKIGLVITELRSRLQKLRIGDIKTKLSEWRIKLESEGGNPESLFNLVYRQMHNIDEADEIDTTLTLYNKLLDTLISGFRIIINAPSFLIIPPFESPPPDIIKNFEPSSPSKNKKALKWIRKAAYVRPRLKHFDDITIFNQIFESADFSFYYDKNKFMQNAGSISNDVEDNNPISMVISMSNKTGMPEDQREKFPPPDPKKLAGLIIDEWVEKIVFPEQDTTVAFHYNGPSTEAPQCLLLAVSPNDSHAWNWDDPTNNTLKDLIVDAMDLMKIRAVDYRSLKELSQFLPTIVVNSSGSPIYTRLYEKGGETE